MNKCLNRGVALVDDVLIIGIAALILTGSVSVAKFTGLFHSDAKQKTQVVQLTTDLQAAKDAAQKAALAQIAKDDAAKRKEAAQHEELRVAKLALAADAKPTPNEAIAAQFVGKVDDSFTLLSQDDASEASYIFTKLSAQDAQDRQAGDDKAKALQAKLDTASQQFTQLTEQNEKSKALAATLLDKTQADGKSLAKWAADNHALLQKLKSFTIWAAVTACLFLLVFHVLPIAAKFFPVLAPFAKGVAAVAAFPLHVLHSAEAEVAKVEAAAASAKLAVTNAALVAGQAALAAEQAAHAQTSATLIKVATTP